MHGIVRFVLHSITVQYCTIKYSTLLYCTIQYCTVYTGTVQYSNVQHNTVQRSTLKPGSQQRFYSFRHPVSLLHRQGQVTEVESCMQCARQCVATLSALLPVCHPRLVERHEVDLARGATLSAGEEYLVISLAQKL